MNQYLARAITIILASLVLVFGAVIGYLFGGYILMASIIIGLLVSYLIAYPILKPRPNQFKVRLLTLIIYGGISTIIIKGDFVINWILNQIADFFGLENVPDYTPSNQLIFFLVFSVFICIITWLFERNTTLPKSKEVKDPVFEKLDYMKLRNRFCDFMVSHLNRIDEDTNWSDSYYTTLEAEIEVSSNNINSPRVASDLVKAIRKNKNTNSFLLIGDPGSGKSVSLRRLARELYGEVPKQGKKAVVPIYINLKEWNGPQNPNDKDISDFIYNHLNSISGRAAKDFLKNYYKKMLDSGLFFIIFDSFDEMPMVLDCDDKSDYIKSISRAFDTFFHDLHRCRGLLSSRPFRQPVGFRAQRLVIRPFSEKQIRQAMRNWLLGQGLDADNLVRRMLKEQPQLAPALRNPFMSDLVASYIKHHRDELPTNYYDLFKHYINQRLTEDESNLKSLSLSKDDLIEGATKIAEKIFITPDIGLEVSLSEIKEAIDDPLIESKIKALQYSRIVRWGGSSKEHFSFVHRRFAEYFAVRSLLSNPNLVKMDAIPQDSRWRDSLVVYCGIASKEQVVEIVNFAWEKIKDYSQELANGNVYNARPAIHCLRFLRDACLSKKDCLLHIEPSFSEYILLLIKNEDHLVSKLATEIIPLVSPEMQTSGILYAFNKKSQWHFESALRSCKNLAGLSESVSYCILYYIQEIPSFKFIKDFRDLDFTLSLSDSLKSIKLINRFDLISLTILWICASFFVIYTLFLGEYIIVVFFIFFCLWVEIGAFYLGNNNTDNLEQEEKVEREIITEPNFFEYRPGFVHSIRNVFKLFITMWIFFNILAFIYWIINKNPEYTIPQFGVRFFILVFGSISGITWYSLYKFSLFKNHSNSITNNIKSNYSESFKTFIPLSIVVVVFVLFGDSKYFDILFYFFGSVVIIPFLFVVIYYGGKELQKSSERKFDAIQDRAIYKKLQIQNDITWSIIFQTLNTFKTDEFQAKYLLKVRKQKPSVSGTYFEFRNFKLKGENSKIELAKLREQVYELVN